MANPAGELNGEALRLDFDRRLTLQFRGSVLTSDAGLIAYRELDDALGLSTMVGEKIADARTGKNGGMLCRNVAAGRIRPPRRLRVKRFGLLLVLLSHVFANSWRSSTESRFRRFVAPLDLLFC